MLLIFEIAASVAGGSLLAVGFPPFDQGWIAWFALVPLLLVLRGKKAGRAFFLSFLCGAAFFLTLFNWILNLSGYTLVHHVLLACYLGAYFGLFGAAYASLSGRFDPVTAAVFTPFLWVSLEFIRSNLSFLALPWGLLGHSQYRFLPLLQVTSVTGAYGVSFLVVMTSALLAALIRGIWSNARRSVSAEKPFRAFLSRQGGKAMFFAAFGILVISLFYGQFALEKPIPGERLKVAVVQGNIAQERKWDPAYAEVILETYRRLSLEASRENPALIVWPEAATPRAINRDPDLMREIRGIAGDAHAFLLMGSTKYQKFSRGHSSGHSRYLNSAFLVPPEESKINGPGRYDKIRLLPFGEYTPLKDWIKWSHIGIQPFDDYEAGTEFTVFTAPDCRFGVTICWENIFPGLVREFVSHGAQFIVNITNEAWFGRSAAPYQFLSMSVFRAVENGVFVVRCANTGVSCVIDPHGRIVARVTDPDGSDTFVDGISVGSVIPAQSGTFYTRHGDWLAWMSLSISCGVLVFILLPLFENRTLRIRKTGVLERKT